MGSNKLNALMASEKSANCKVKNLWHIENKWSSDVSSTYIHYVLYVWNAHKDGRYSLKNVLGVQFLTG